MATVVILRKPAKATYTTLKSYRPIGLLPDLCQILEKMAVACLKRSEPEFFLSLCLEYLKYFFISQIDVGRLKLKLDDYVRYLISDKLDFLLTTHTRFLSTSVTHR